MPSGYKYWDVNEDVTKQGQTQRELGNILYSNWQIFKAESWRNGYYQDLPVARTTFDTTGNGWNFETQKTS